MIDAKHLRGACRDCPRILVIGTLWRGAPKEEREAWLAEGFTRHHGRGLCSMHYRKRSRQGTLIDAERQYVSTEELLRERENLCDPYDPLAVQARQLADRLSMKFDAVERSLYRAGVRSKLRSGGHRYKTEAA